MKKRLLAILLSAAMVVCLMPTMAFADVEAPAEEVALTEMTEEVEEEIKEEEKEGIQSEAEKNIEEAQVTENEEEEQLSNESDELEGEKLAQEVATPQYVFKHITKQAGHFSGYNYIIDEVRDWEIDVYVADDKIQNDAKSIDNAAIKAAIDKSFNEKHRTFCSVSVSMNATEGNIFYSSHTTHYFYNINVTANTDKKVGADSTFTYDVDSIYGTVDKWTYGEESVDEAQKIEKTDKVKYEWIKNAVTIMKGAQTVTDNLLLRIDNYYEYSYEVSDVEENWNGWEEYQSPDLVFIKEASAPKNFNLDGTVWGVVEKWWYDYYSKDQLTRTTEINENAEDVESYYYIKTFALTGYNNDVAAFVADVNKAYQAEFEAWKVAGLNETKTYTIANPMKAVVDKLTVADGMTFTHTTIVEKKSTKKGVQTGDNNELGLWITLGMFASVAAAAYALKRREN